MNYNFIQTHYFNYEYIKKQYYNYELIQIQYYNYNICGEKFLKIVVLYKCQVLEQSEVIIYIHSSEILINSYSKCS